MCASPATTNDGSQAITGNQVKHIPQNYIDELII